MSKYEACPLTQTMNIIGGKWLIPALKMLAEWGKDFT